MKFRSLILGAVVALALAVPGFAQNTTTTAPTQSLKAVKPFDKIVIYVSTYVNEPNDVAKNFLNPLVDKLEAQGATLKEDHAPVDAPNAFEFRIFLYSASDGTASFTVNLLAHTKGNAYPEYLGAGTALLDATDEAEIVDQFIASVTETFTNYLTAKNPANAQ